MLMTMVIVMMAMIEMVLMMMMVVMIGVMMMIMMILLLELGHISISNGITSTKVVVMLASFTIIYHTSNTPMI